MDYKFSLPETWDYHSEHSPEHPIFMYDDGPDIHTVTWRQANLATHRAARIVKSIAEEHGLPILDPLKPPIIGILAIKGTREVYQLFYFITG